MIKLLRIDPDSPLTRSACSKLGIDPQEMIKKNKNEFRYQDDESQKVIDMRYKNYHSRYQSIVRQVLEEKKIL